MEKNAIKQYFRSGSRPTQQHFHALIDACYNTGNSIGVSGYDLKTDVGDESPVKSIKFINGKTLIIPRFRHINTPHTRMYHYNLPCCNIAPGFRLHHILMEVQLPENKTYELKDKTSTVKIKQSISMGSISFLDGDEVLHAVKGMDIPSGNPKEFKIDAPLPKGAGINVDIAIQYDIKSNIAVSDQFDVAALTTNELEHVFGGLLCTFKIPPS